jgi:large subunit ribosomal protein L18
MDRKIDKTASRLRRAKKTRIIIKKTGLPRLCVSRSSNNIYAQLISSCGGRVLSVASTLEQAIKDQVNHGGNKEAAALVGGAIGKRILELGIEKVAFDRSGYKYHGCIKALADAARETGVVF